MIEEISEFLSSAHKEKRILLLHELIWTVDSQLHAIPSAEEINQALNEFSFQIERKEDEIYLIPSTGKNSGRITNVDVQVAMKIYEETVAELINKHKK